MKAYTKGAKLKARKAGLPELAGVPKKQPNGRTRRRKEMHDDDPAKLALMTRARLAGKSPDDLDEMRRPAYGEEAGRAIYAMHSPKSAKTAEALWETYKSCSTAYQRYMTTCIGASPYPKTMRIEMAPERFEVDTSHTPDHRSAEERHRSATNAWATWLSLLDGIGIGHAAEIYAAMHGLGDLMSDGTPTPQGQRFIAALRELMDRRT